jgi:hypothetical protein
MSRTTQNAKHLIKVNFMNVAEKIKKFRKPRGATKANK